MTFLFFSICLLTLMWWKIPFKMWKNWNVEKRLFVNVTISRAKRRFFPNRIPSNKLWTFEINKVKKVNNRLTTVNFKNLTTSLFIINSFDNLTKELNWLNFRLVSSTAEKAKNWPQTFNSFWLVKHFETWKFVKLSTLK